jgi:hypothetical protein
MLNVCHLIRSGRPHLEAAVGAEVFSGLKGRCVETSGTSLGLRASPLPSKQRTKGTAMVKPLRLISYAEGEESQARPFFRSGSLDNSFPLAVRVLMSHCLNLLGSEVSDPSHAST